jgi:signal transduction histidine kinase
MAEAVASADQDAVGLQKAFREYEGALAVDNARRAATLAAVFMIGGWLMDRVVFPEHMWAFLLNRSICVILLGVVFLMLGRVSSLKASSRIGWAIPILPMASICVMIVQTGGGNSSYYGGLNLVLVGLSLLLRWSFMDSLLMVGTCFLSYSVSVLVAPESLHLQTFANNCFFLLVTSVFVVAGSYYYERLRFREFSLRDQVEKSRVQLESQNRQLSELDEAKTRFFANISHELRTPLTIMLGITERLKAVLAREHPTPQIEEMTAMLGQSGLRLLKLIDDLLDLVRFDTGHADVRRQPTLIEPHIEGLLGSLRHLAEQDRVALFWKCEADAPSIQLDRDKFDKILLNLVINAIKFTPSGGVIEVKVRVVDGGLSLTVEDSGVGIPPEVLPRIFERFWQVDTSSTRKFQGAGIGLALVRSLTEAMDGEVKVESKVGHGTTFSVSLPVEVAEQEQVGEEDALESGGQIADMHRRAAMSFQGKGQSRVIQSGIGVGAGVSPGPVIGSLPSGARPLVLIADDEPDIRRFLRMQLEGADVIEASDGVEAMELVRQRRPQLALLDHMMPEMDGVEVCRRIRENHTTRGVAVIILTARADEQTKLDALQAGANDFLTKPFSTAELGLRLQNQLVMARIRREMVDLNQELQSALEQIKESEVLMVRNEKLSSLGRMSAGIIHEINNPLNYSRAGLHILETYTRHLPEGERPDYEDTVKDIREGVERVAQIVIDLRQFTRDDNGIAGDADLCEVIGRARRMVGHQVGKEIAFDAEMPGQAVIRGNPNQLVQVFINLFQNSIDAIHQRVAELGGEPGRIRVTIEPAGEGWTVGVRDNGIGIPPENLQNIFDPFFTSKDVGKGMGLGLSITHQILQNHSAKVDVESRPGQFTCFHLTFPGANQVREMESVLDHFE